MFFSKEEDSLAQALKNPKLLSKPSSTKVIKLTREEELEIQRAKQAVRELQEEEFNATTKRSNEPDYKPQHFSNTDSNFLPRKRQTDKKNDEFDDILSALDAIENPNQDKKAQTTNSFQPKTLLHHQNQEPENQKDAHNFFGDLDGDQDFEVNSNRATFNKTATDKFAKTSQSFHTAAHDDIKNRRANLFGLSKEMSGRNSEVNSNNQSFSKPANDGIGTIDLGVSRRKKQRNPSKDGRPNTSPLEKSSPPPEKNDFFEANLGIPDKAPRQQAVSHLNIDDNDDHIGEYVPSIASNKANSKPPLIRKSGQPPSQTGMQLSPSLSMKNLEKLDAQFDKVSIDNFDGRSKNNDLTGNEDIGSFGGVGNMGNLANTLGNTGNIASIGLTVSRKRTDDAFKNQQQQSVRPLSNINAMFNNMNQTNNANLGNSFLPRDKSTEVEELRQHIETLKRNHEDQVKTLKTNHAEELEFERKGKTKLAEDLEKQREREIERLKENYESEIKRKDELHKLEVDQIRRKYEMEVESLKREIEQQVKISSLANEIQKHNDRLYDISEKLDLQRTQEDYAKTGEVYKREQLLLEKERSLQKMGESLENEKRRLDFARQEIDNERGMLRKEYKRLDELQANIKTVETEKQKDLLMEKKRIEKEREALEREKKELKETNELKQREHERLLEVFETEKHELFKQNERFQEGYRAKVREVEEMRGKLMQSEADLMKRRGLVEKKEMELAKTADALNTKNERLRMEQQEFEKEARKVNEIAAEVQKESEFLSSFKRNFDLEKENIRRKQLELDSYASALNHEKNSIGREKYDLELRAKTIDNLRFEVVKGLEENPEYVRKINVVGNEIEKKREFLTRTTKENKKDVWNVIRKEGSNQKSEVRRKEEFQGFNTEKYMGYLKRFNDEHAQNQAFLNIEREEIMGKTK